MATQIKLRRDTNANWTANSTVVLGEGEIGVNLTNGQFKLGDGTSTWSALTYFQPGAGSLSVTTNSASGVGSLSYSTGVLTFTPAASYALPTASTTVLGGVKVDGTSITINGSGVISGANTYTLPATTTTTLGGVIIPSVATSGINNTSGTIGLATATTTQLGGVKVDNSTIVITDGVIAVSSALTSATQFKGNWDASTNTPVLSNSLPGGVAAGWEYIVGTGGIRDIGNGSTAWSIGDLVIYDGAKWVRIPSGNNVVSFNTRQGAITLLSSDVTTALGFTPGASVGSSSITTLGTIGTGVWNGSVIAGQYGGTGVANTGKTITLGGNLTTSGAYAITLIASAVTSVTLPTSGTLATQAGTETLTNKTLGATTVAGHLVPNTDVAYDLGSVTYKFRDLYLSGSSIKLGDATITASGTTLTIPASSTLTTPVIATNITTGSTNFSLINTTATTVNFAGAATTALTIGASNAPITGFARTATTASTASSLGYLGLPQSATATTATLAIGDAGKHVYVTTASQTITIPANGTVAYPIGTTLTFIAGPSATTVSIAIATDTMRLAGGALTGTRTLAANGMATAVKVAATTWYINGVGLT
jgi:hypothetical protein